MSERRLCLFVVAGQYDPAMLIRSVYHEQGEGVNKEEMQEGGKKLHLKLDVRHKVVR